MTSLPEECAKAAWEATTLVEWKYRGEEKRLLAVKAIAAVLARRAEEAKKENCNCLGSQVQCLVCRAIDRIFGADTPNPNRVMRGLTWAEAWARQHEFPYWRVPNRQYSLPFVGIGPGEPEFWARRDFEISTDADFNGQEVQRG